MRRTLEPCPHCFCHDRKDETILPVPGEGNRLAKVFLVGECPGRFENSVGRPFVGKTGDELSRTYLPLAGLTRGDDTYITNSVKCKWADGGDPPPDEIVRSCAEFHLRRELEDVKPEIVVLMGGISNSLVGQDVTTTHGTARYGEILGHKCLLYSTWHPALGIHMGSAMQALLDDFTALKGFIRGESEPLVDAIPNPAYYRLTTADQVEVVMAAYYDEPIAVDTESALVWHGTSASKRYVPFCATFCIFPGEAFLVKVSDTSAWERFGYHATKFRKIILHNAPHDVRVLGQAGIKLDWSRVSDTLSMAYIVANVPKGLKPLSRKLLGVTARSFEDVVRPYGIHAAMEYFEQAALVEWPEPVQEETGEMETKKCSDCKGTGVLSIGKGKSRQFFDCYCDGGVISQMKMTRRQGLNQKIRRLVGDYVKNGDSIDPYERFNSWMEDGCALPLVRAMGPPPLPSISLVPMTEVESYACLDALSTRRVYPILKDKMRQIRRSVRAD